MVVFFLYNHFFFSTFVMTMVMHIVMKR